MPSCRAIAMSTAIVLMGFGCSKSVLVTVPPRVDLQSYDIVGVVDFASGTEDDLAQVTTQRFIQSLQESQPGVQVLELGDESELMLRLGTKDRNFTTMQAIGKEYGVDVVILGDLTVSEIKPNIGLTSMIRSVSASAEVDASLTARMYDTSRGATLWTNSARDKRTVARMGLGSGGSVHLDANDPDNVYAGLVDALVGNVTRDFRASHVRESR